MWNVGVLCGGLSRYAKHLSRLQCSDASLVSTAEHSLLSQYKLELDTAILVAYVNSRATVGQACRETLARGLFCPVWYKLSFLDPKNPKCPQF